ncbi:F-box/kelch-repeat protein At3g06240-like [Lotus japonicus]|uniref:F-box/kelch-repeat protein At3g06240-like n=1 Tax=Lotus japonicus TaxID=34305 RepID=UPI0025906707|nr:F-box/kelch-repeat protein At3g06240-like [Lotus japonicus]XP_057417828.1 F-box/kelch-repeat protein At3g06240-like [Lotus japonicus]
MMRHNCRRRSIESLNLSSILPHDLIVQILLRLPVRSLLRFKSVCKSWLSLISDPQFGKSHFDLAAAPTHRCLVKINNFKLESLDVDASVLDQSSEVNLKFPYTGYVIFHIQILGSCRGFIALVRGGDAIVWNPSTCVQRKIADDIEMKIYGHLYGFGYDKSTDDFLLVFIDLIAFEFFEDGTTVAEYHSSIEIFSLKTPSLFYPEPIPYVKPEGFNSSYLGFFLNEALHWLVTNAETYLHAIIAYDLVERSLSEIPLSPILAAKLQHQVYYLRVMEECLSLCYPGDATSMAEIWMMKEYKVQSSWMD